MAEKRKRIIKILIIAIIVILSVKYILPLIWPFAFAYIIGEGICKTATFLRKKLQFNYSVAVASSLTVLVIIISFAFSKLFELVFTQGRELIINWSKYQDGMDKEMKSICCRMETAFNLTKGSVYQSMCSYVSDLGDIAKDKILSIIMNDSTAVIIFSVEIIAAFVVIIMGAYFYAKDRDKIKIYITNLQSGEEIISVKRKLGIVFKAYIKAQLIIMVVTIAICAIGLALIKNKYFMIVAIIIGVLDALPLIGSGLIFIPWIIIHFILGNVRKGVVILIIYMLCYFSREVLEPKLIGKGIGLNPLVSLICIYVGYEIFGVLGVFFGPVVYMVIEQLVDYRK